MEEDKKVTSPIDDKPQLDGTVKISKPKRKRMSPKEWWQTHKPTKRRLIQVYAALLTNANIKGFTSGRIYSGAVKNVCAPGLNCYSCPGAAASCPLGALQNSFAQSGTRAPYYVIGIILLFGLMLARTICGFLCPFGLIQDLIYKIKTPKLKKSRVTRVLSYLKYVILAVFVISIPLIYGVIGQIAIPAFCKYICPAGTFGGAIGLLVNPANADMYGMLHGLFTWKFGVLIAVLVACVFLYRPFCRFLCPLGALYGFFNRYALLGIKLDKSSCTDCGLCISHCKMDVLKVGDHECINCGECISVCPTKAISWKGSKLFVHGNTTEAPVVERPLNPVLATAAVGAGQSNVVLNTPGNISFCTSAPVSAGSSSGSNVESSAPVKKGKGRAFWLQVAAWSTALVVLLGALVYYNFIDKNVTTGGNQVGDLCYDFTLSSYNDEEDFTLSDYRGKIVLINFWATWCGPCVTELPEFQRIKEEYSDVVEVVAIHSANITEDVQPYLNTKADVHNESRTWSEWDIHFVQDTGDMFHSDIYDMLGGRDSYPVTLVVDKDGYITFVKQGSITYNSLRLQIRAILAAEQ